MSLTQGIVCNGLMHTVVLMVVLPRLLITQGTFYYFTHIEMCGVILMERPKYVCMHINKVKVVFFSVA